MRKSEVKTSFLIKKEYLNVIHNRKPEQKAELFDCMFEYQTTWKYTTQSERIEDMMTAMIDFRNKNDEKYDDISEQRSLAWKKHKWNQYTKMEQMEQNGTNETNGTDKNRLDKIWLDKNNIILSSNEDNEQSSYWNKDINDVIWKIKNQCNVLWIAYDKTKEREFTKHILTAKEFWEFAEKVWQSRVDLALNIQKASFQIWFFKWICAWPKMIYQHYAEVYNEYMKQRPKTKTVVLDDIC